MNKALLVCLCSGAVALSTSAECFNYPNFNSTAGLTLTGSAAPAGGVLRLTPAVDGQTGDAWLTGKQACAGGFDTSFHFRITTLGNIFGNEPGGDGFTLSVQNVSQTDNSWAMGGTNNYVSVFFNTFWNWPGCTCPDVSDNSVGILVNQTYIAQNNLNPLGIQMSDGAVHLGRVRYDGASLSVWVDGVVVLTNVPLAGLLPGVDNAGQGWVGFTAGTGAAYENHDILDWSICLTNPLPPCTPAPSGVVSWWRAESSALDSVDGNNGTIQGPVSFVAGEVGQAFDLNGYYSGVQLGTPANIQLQTFTIEAWVKRHSATQATLDPSHPDNGAFLHYDVGGYGFAPANDGRLLLTRVGVSSVSSSALRLTDTNGFHHVAVTTTGSNVVFYLDGVPESVGPYDPGYTFSGPVAIGGRGGDLAASFYGAIDELSVYNRALAPDEILALYDAGSAGKCVAQPPGCTEPPAGAVSWWQAESNALDSVDSNNGSFVGVAEVTTGKVGAAFTFDGLSGYVQVPSSANLKVSGPFTIEGWINYQGAPHVYSGDIVVTKGIDAEAAQDWALAVSENSTLRPHVNSGGGWHYFDCGTVLNPGTWYHVAMVYDGTQLSGYVNGAQDGTTAASGAVQTTDGALRIGAYAPVNGSASKGFFQGQIDELTLYDRALSSNEIATIYSAGSAGKCPPPPAVPAITSFNPVSGGPGWLIQIHGTNFSPIAAHNIVYFGAVRATVQSATPSLLNVMVPIGATYAPITVTVNGLVAASGTPFKPTFAGDSDVDASSFAPRVDLAAPSGPIFTAIADIDGDGKPDLVVNNAYAHSLSLYRNISTIGSINTGSFAPPVNFDVAGGDPDNPYGLAVADVDGDGKPDVVICNRLLSTVSVYRNISTVGSLTTASLSPPVSLPVGLDPRHVALADLNGDGKPDMVSVNYGGNTISLLQNIGSAGSLSSNSFMAAVDLPAGSLPYEVAIGDLDGDGEPDLAVTSDNFLLLFRNTGVGGNLGVGSFASPAQLASPSGTGIGIALGDLDGDGKPDLVSCTYLSQTMSVFRNQSTPGTLTSASFAPRVDFAPGCRGHTVALSDLNGDGKADIGFVGEIPDHFSVYQNISTPGTFTTGSLATPVLFPTGYNAWGISIGDLDGDGRPDVVFCNSYDISISIYRNVIATGNPPGCTALPAGAVSWWQAESNALDSVDGNNGSLIGGTAFTIGEVGQAFTFDGLSGYVQVPSSANLKVSGPFTIEGWINYQGAPHVYSGDIVVTKGIDAEAPQDWALAVSENSTLRPHVNSGGGWHYFDCGTVLNPGTWYHVAMVYDGTQLSGYVNGAVDGTTAASGAVQTTDGALRIGAYAPVNGSASKGFFQGQIDELTLYDRALSSNEIATIYNAGSAGKCNLPIAPFITGQPTNRTVFVGQPATFIVKAGGTPPLQYQWLFEGAPLLNQTNSAITIFNAQLSNAGNYSVIVSNVANSVTSSNALLTVNPLPPCTPPPAGLVSWWRFQNDLLDNWDSNNGTAPVGSSFVDGKVGQAFNASQRLVVVPDSPSLQFSNALTIEAWVKPSIIVNPTPRTIVSKFESVFNPQLATQSSFFLGTTNNGQVIFLISSNGFGLNNAKLITSQFIPSNAWTFVVATYDGAAMRIYLNGTLAAQSNYSKGIFMGTDNLGIGALPTGGTTYIWPFFGAIDEVSLYNRALSGDEIVSIYNSDFIGKCLVAPTIIAQPLSQVIPENEDVKFSVSVLGSRPLKYQWLFDGSPQVLFGATNATLILEKVKTNRTGFYSVLVSNSEGSTISAVAALKVGPPPTCTPLPAGAISWWPADNSPLDAVDGNNGLGASFNPAGKVSQTFNFNGSAGGVQVNNSASLNFGSSSNFSVEGWIKALPPAPQRYLYPNTPILEKGLQANQTGVGYSLSLNQGRLACWLGTNSQNLNTNSAIFISPGPDLRDGMFHHVAVTLDRSSTTGGKLFVDGNVVLTFNAFSRRGDLSSTSPLYIGAPTTVTSNSLFYGFIDEMTIYNRALATNEIQAIAGAGSAGKCRVAPFILVQPTNQLANAGSNVTFSVVAGGNPNLRYQWFRSLVPPVGVPIAGATSPTYVITNVQVSQLGIYFVRVTNFFGLVNSSNAVLDVRLPALPANSALQVGLTDGRPLLQFPGVPGQQYSVQASTNLIDWTVIGTATDFGDGTFEFADPEWTNYNARYYRIILP